MDVTFAEIYRATNRLPFANFEVEAAIDFVKRNRAGGLLTSVHRCMGDTPPPYEVGIFVSEAADLDRDILFAKIDGGRGFFGGRKARFLSYLGKVGTDQFEAGPSFSSFPMAITSINNIYRAVRLLA
ncbi:hypothetical protein [Afipia felis]|uniref:Uncharacterized protein n=2 Tax=Afipia felis TaxID=1035 RepID=A0A380WC05_AFIFE|nr:hypothetical protein [Afipia felis]EKS29762.1 hypothetical protein HMPREF9697_02290 [Afipia felis ATCC 53690]SUU78469.1 Uncharacterised protein [Afipia felis]SUU86534.1 Uncharacterised protein [Afipia felis]